MGQKLPQDRKSFLICLSPPTILGRDDFPRPDMRKLVLAGLFLLAGCVSPQQVQKARTDASVFREQQRARDVREKCLDEGAMPGTTAYLACQLRLEKPAPRN